jgi:methionine sulfoxide reductase heme-binding subunit
MRVNWFEGWRLFALLMLTLTALSLWIAGMHAFDADGMRRVIRFTARTSLVFFCTAFSAASAGATLAQWLDAVDAATAAILV